MTAEVAEGYEVIEDNINAAARIIGDIRACWQSHGLGQSGEMSTRESEDSGASGLREEQWQRFSRLLPSRIPPTGWPGKDDRTIIIGILRVPRNGASYRSTLQALAGPPRKEWPLADRS